MNELFAFPTEPTRKAKKRLTLIGLAAVSLLAVLFLAPLSAEGWSTSESASVDCYQNVSATFHNTEPHQAQYSMDVTVNATTKTVAGDSSATWTFKQNSPTVTFYLKWTDGHPGTDSRTVTVTPATGCVTSTTTTSTTSTTVPSTTTTKPPTTTTTVVTTTTTQPTTTTTTAPSTTTTSTTTPSTTTTTAPSTTTSTTTSTVPSTTTTTTAPSTTSTVVQSTTSTTVVKPTPTTAKVTPTPTGSLPRTGVESGTLIKWGIALALIGLLVMGLRELLRV